MLAGFVKDLEPPKDYQEYLAQKKINPETELPFSSRKEYRKYKDSQNKKPSYYPTQSANVLQTINPETGENFHSISEYNRYRARCRENNPRNKKISQAIREGLEKSGGNVIWLAYQLGVSERTVYNYYHGSMLPSEKRMEQISQILGISNPFDLESRVEN
jgi:ribosome-binding protein aMBF1 (putative translation factor)